MRNGCRFCVALVLLGLGCTGEKPGQTGVNSGQEYLPPTQGARSISREYQAHLARQGEIDEKVAQIILHLQESLATKVLPPEEQLEGLKTRLREVGAPAEVENRIDAIVAKQAEEGTAVADAREFCNSELDAIEGVYPGFRQGLHQKYTFFSCVTHDLERSLSRVRFALICQITASQENCLGQLTEDEKTWANDVLAAVEG